MIGVPRRIVIGIGNLERGDDAAGRMVLRRLRRRLTADVELIEHSGEAASLLASLEGASTAYLIDACNSGSPPGTLFRFEAALCPWPRALRSCSTHGLGLAEALELAAALGTLPARCLVYAIEGARYALGDHLSAPVRAQIDSLVPQLVAEIEFDRACDMRSTCVSSARKVP